MLVMAVAILHDCIPHIAIHKISDRYKTLWMAYVQGCRSGSAAFHTAQACLPDASMPLLQPLCLGCLLNQQTPQALLLATSARQRCMAAVPKPKKLPGLGLNTTPLSLQMYQDRHLSKLLGGVGQVGIMDGVLQAPALLVQALPPDQLRTLLLQLLHPLVQLRHLHGQAVCAGVTSGSGGGSACCTSAFSAWACLTSLPSGLN